MINDPKLINEILDEIKNTSKEDLDKAIEEIDKELRGVKTVNDRGS